MNTSHALIEGSAAPDTKTTMLCDLCGASIGRSRVQSIQDGRTLHFCCPGCRMVFDILFHHPEGPPTDYRDTDLYRACVEAGIIAQSPREGDRSSAVAENPGVPEPAWDHHAGRPGDSVSGREGRHSAPFEALQVRQNHPPSETHERSTHEYGTAGEELTFRVGGMWCVTCALLVESFLRSTRGVLEAKVFFLSDTAHIQYLPHRTTPHELIERVSRLGYPASLAWDESESFRERKALQLRLGVAAILTCNIMMIACALYFGFFQDLGEDGVRTLSWPLWMLATPVVFYAGAPILKKAVLGVRWGSISMETLISLGALTAYFYSTYQTLSGSLHVYYDTAAMLVTLVLLGKYIEAGARDSVSRGVMELLRADGEKTRILDGGRERWVSSREVGVGDEFLVRAGERVPMDGEILEGQADVDDSILTGESRPTVKRGRDEILSGSLVLNGEVRAGAIRLNHESMLKQMIALIHEALAAKIPGEELADRIIRWIVPAIVVLALATGVWVWMGGHALEQAVQRALTVLVITCPCALGLATPLAKVASISAGKSRGLILRDPGALDRIRTLDAFVFDKTGTITEGAFCLRHIVAPLNSESEVLRRLGPVEARSNHLMAREILRRCRENGIEFKECTAYEAFEGMGVRGMVGGEEIRIGNRRFMIAGEHEIPPDLDRESMRSESMGMSTAFFAWGGSVRGFLCLGDKIRNSSRETLQALRASGVRLWVISGDSPETTRAVASSLSLEGFQGGMRPSDKADFVKKLQQEGYRVGVVGDGINDAPALAQAEVAITVGNRTDLLREISAVTLLNGGISGVLDAIALSRLHTRVSAQNLFFAFAYNGLAIPIAMAGLLNPIVAVVAMFLSSLTVLANTLRISRFALWGTATGRQQTGDRRNCPRNASDTDNLKPEIRNSKLHLRARTSTND